MKNWRNHAKSQRPRSAAHRQRRPHPALSALSGKIQKDPVHRPVLCGDDHPVRHHPAQDHEHHHQLRHGRGHHPHGGHRAQAGGSVLRAPHYRRCCAVFHVGHRPHHGRPHRDGHAPGRLRPSAQARPHLLQQHQGRHHHGPHHQRPVRRDRVRPPLPRGIFHRGHQDPGILPHPVSGQCAADAGGVRLRAADGRRVRQAEPAPARPVPPAARPDR